MTDGGTTINRTTRRAPHNASRDSSRRTIETHKRRLSTAIPNRATPNAPRKHSQGARHGKLITTAPARASNKTNLLSVTRALDALTPYGSDD